MKNILLLATSDEQGAGIVARYTNEGFRKSGHNSILVVKASALINDNVIVLEKPVTENSFHFYLLKIVNKAERLYQRINPVRREVKYYFHNLNERKVHVEADKILASIPFKPEVILLLWVSNFVNAKTINDLYNKTGAKIVWLMTDNAPLTGGCHYPWDCEGFHTDCSDCPALVSPPKKYIARKNLIFKKENIPDLLELVTGSEFDYRKAAKAAVFKGKKIHKLVAPIDHQKFNPGSKTASKSYFAIDAGKKVIFYGVQLFSDSRKGVQLFLDALEILGRRFKEDHINPDDYLLLMAGNGEVDFSRNTSIPVKHLGFLNEENLVKAFQAADVYVCSSVQDSGPLMINQSVMCGTPVVAFEMGVAPDLVHTGKTGYLAKLADADDMAAGIQYVLSLPENEFQKMCAECRAFAVNNFTMEIYAKKIMNLIQQ
jgi:glycosyltransferase involved in cell wall biosynthesis